MIEAAHFLVTGHHATPFGRLPARSLLLRHATEGWALVDTGLDGSLMRLPGAAAALYRLVTAPRPAGEDPLGATLTRLGLTARDVGRVVVTHLHPDHVCGLSRFGHAAVHMAEEAWALVRAPRRVRLRHGLLDGLLPPGLAPVIHRGALRIFGDDHAVTVPLPGHAPGHQGVHLPGLDTLYACDASWGEARADRTLTPVVGDAATARATRAALAGRAGTVLFCHTPSPHPWDVTP